MTSEEMKRLRTRAKIQLPPARWNHLSICTEQGPSWGSFIQTDRDSDVSRYFGLRVEPRTTSIPVIKVAWFRYFDELFDGIDDAWVQGLSVHIALRCPIAQGESISRRWECRLMDLWCQAANAPRSDWQDHLPEWRRTP